MALIQDGVDGSRILAVEPGISAARVALVSRGYGYSTAATTGTVAAALAANSAVFLMRLDVGSPKRAFIERIRLEFACLVAFTTPITAGRRLGIYRGAGATATSGGSAITAVPKHGSTDTSEFSIANGGDLRIATTGALTATSATFEAAFTDMSLVHVGTAGAYRDVLYEYGGAEAQPIQLDPGQLLAIRNPVAMDAAGTWQLAVTLDWHEAPALDFTG